MIFKVLTVASPVITQAAVQGQPFFLDHPDAAMWLLSASVTIACIYTVAVVRRFEKTCERFDTLQGEHNAMMKICPGIHHQQNWEKEQKESEA